MRILLMVHQFLPEHVAGTELVALDVAKGLAERGHEVEIFAGFPVKRALADGERFDEFEFEGLRVHRFLHQFVPMGGQKNIVELEYDNRLFAGYLRRFLTERNFGGGDVVHFFHIGRLGVRAVDVCLEAGVVTVFTPTDFWGICPFSQLRLPNGELCGGPDVFSANCLRHAAEVEGKKSLLKVLPDSLVAAAAGGIREGVLPERWYSDFVRALTERPGFIRRRLNRMEAILPPSKFMLEMLVRNGIHLSKMRYLPHGVNAEHIRRNVLRGGVGGGEKLRVGFLGTLAEHKGVHVLVEAVKLLPREVEVEVHVHGKLREFPVYAARLEEMVRGDGRFVFHGPYAAEKIGEILDSVDVVVVPSLWYENSPLVIQAAQAAGCPVLASDAGGMAELISHNRDGVLFEMGNVRELARVIGELARDRGKVRRLAENAPGVKSVGDYVEELVKLYGELVRRAGT